MKTPRKSRSAVAMGRKGGLARAARLRAGEIPVSGAAVPKPTYCGRCGELQPSAALAKAHRKSENCKPRPHLEEK